MSTECENAEMSILFTFEALHNFHLEILEITKECIIVYLSLEDIGVQLNSPSAQGHALSRLQNKVLCGCSSILSALHDQ